MSGCVLVGVTAGAAHFIPGEEVADMLVVCSRERRGLIHGDVVGVRVVRVVSGLLRGRWPLRGSVVRGGG